MVANKEVMARNIRRYMEKMQVNATDVCKALQIKQNTFSDWVNAKTYPRIDKIEAMANYFGIRKSDLVEEGHVDVTLELSSGERVLIELYRNDPDFRQFLRLSKYQELFERMKQGDKTDED